MFLSALVEASSKLQDVMQREKTGASRRSFNGEMGQFIPLSAA
jgi:hypothetical protein